MLGGRSWRVLLSITHRQHVLGDDDCHIVDDEAVPEDQARVGWFDEKLGAKEQEEEASHQVAQAKHTDPGGPCNKHHRQHKPEEMAEHQDLGHVQVAPFDGGVRGKGGGGFTQCGGYLNYIMDAYIFF